MGLALILTYIIKFAPVWPCRAPICIFEIMWHAPSAVDASINHNMTLATRYKHTIAPIGDPGTHDNFHSAHIHPIDLGIASRLRTADRLLVTYTPPCTHLPSCSGHLDNNLWSYMHQIGANSETWLLDTTEARPTKWPALY